MYFYIKIDRLIRSNIKDDYVLVYLFCMKGMNFLMEHWMKRRIIVTCPICNRKFNLLGIKNHIKELHWNASDDFLRKWEISDDYIKLSKEERYYKYRPERNPYRFLIDDDAMVLKRWFLKKKEAKSRDIMFVLTFEDYCKLIYDAGIKSSDIGWEKHQMEIIMF